MIAIILAAGYGTRLGRLTGKKPKVLIEVGGRPIIDHIIARLNNAGIHQIIVNLHYLSEMVTRHLGDKVLYFHEPKLLGHLGTIEALQGWLTEDFMVVNGDTLSNVDYNDMIAYHQENTVTALMDEWRCVGTWIYSPVYFKNKHIPVYSYRQPSLVWFDIGKPDRLEEARRYFDEGADRVS